MSVEKTVWYFVVFFLGLNFGVVASRALLDREMKNKMTQTINGKNFICYEGEDD